MSSWQTNLLIPGQENSLRANYMYNYIYPWHNQIKCPVSYVWLRRLFSKPLAAGDFLPKPGECKPLSRYDLVCSLEFRMTLWLDPERCCQGAEASDTVNASLLINPGKRIFAAMISRLYGQLFTMSFFILRRKQLIGVLLGSLAWLDLWLNSDVRSDIIWNISHTFFYCVRCSEISLFGQGPNVTAATSAAHIKGCSWPFAWLTQQFRYGTFVLLLDTTNATSTSCCCWKSKLIDVKEKKK